MNKKLEYFKQIHPQTAYIAGAIEIASGPLDAILGKDYYGLATDILWTGSKGVDGLYEALLNRLRKYNSVEQLALDLEQDPFMPNVPINKLQESSAAKALTRLLYKNAKSPEIEQLSKDFFYTANWYLKQPQGVYQLDMQVLEEYMPELSKALTAFYLFVITDILFIDYGGYVMMLVVGSAE